MTHRARMGEKQCIFSDFSAWLTITSLWIRNNIRHWEETIWFEVDLQFRHLARDTPAGVYSSAGHESLRAQPFKVHHIFVVIAKQMHSESNCAFAWTNWAENVWSTAQWPRYTSGQTLHHSDPNKNVKIWNQRQWLSPLWSSGSSITIVLVDAKEKKKRKEKVLPQVSEMIEAISLVEVLSR